MPAKPLTEQQLAESAKLKDLFSAWQESIAAKEGKKPSQLYAASKLEMTQGALNQYLNGKIPLNTDAALNFSHLLGCLISDFSPSIDEHLSSKVSHINSRLLHANNSEDYFDEALTGVKHGWPFGKRISPSQYASLSEEQKNNIEFKINGYLEDNALKSKGATARKATN